MNDNNKNKEELNIADDFDRNIKRADHCHFQPSKGVLIHTAVIDGLYVTIM